jgi:hypothetical protein
MAGQLQRIAVLTAVVRALQVSEYASYSVTYYRRIIDAALEAAGAPRDLVQIVTGYGDAGAALVNGGVDKVVFVGSTVVGKKVGGHWAVAWPGSRQYRLRACLLAAGGPMAGPWLCCAAPAAPLPSTCVFSNARCAASCSATGNKSSQP